MKKSIFICVVLLCCSNTVMAGCSGDKMLKGWCWPTGTDNIGNYLNFGEQNSNYHNRHHLAQDIDANEGDAVYAIADGEVLHVRDNISGYGGLKNCSPTHTDNIPGAGIIIKHRTIDNQEFIALYAHLKNVQVGATVVVGQKIGEVRNYTACGSRMDHLHFGIRFPNNDDSNRWAGYELGGNYYNFINPINFLNAHYPLNLSVGYRIISNTTWYNSVSIAWAPANVPCDKASVWAYNETCSAENNHAGICQTAYDELVDMAYWKYGGDDWQTIFFGDIDDFQDLCY